MSVRLRLALTVLFTGLATALGVVVAVALAFERFEHEAAYARADAFLGRVMALHSDLHEQQRRDPEGFTAFLKSLLLLEPASQLYLLAPDGTVLASSGNKALAPDFKVTIAPVRAAAAAAVGPEGLARGASAPSADAPRRVSAYVMGDDPEFMDRDAVIAARALQQTSIRPGTPVAGYLYLVCRKPGLPASRLARLAEQLAGPALGPVLAVIALASLLAAWIIAAVTRPLAQLSEDVARVTRQGFLATGAGPGPVPLPPPVRAYADDEFGRLHAGFQMLLERLHAQWDQLRRLDAFRRESVSNLSHDLRSPLTAAAAGLETLQQRWQGSEGDANANAARAEDRRLVEVALRNTHSAARLVRALGDLAVLDEASFRLRLVRIDLAEVLDDVVMRFAERASRQGVALRGDFDDSGEPLAAEVDIELIERAMANLLDNALRFTPAGGRIVLAARRVQAAAATAADLARAQGRASAHRLRLTVQDSGSGIAAEDLGHLFDRHFQGRRPGDTARAEGGKGLGLAIVQRIVELHGGEVALQSAPGQGTTVTLDLPAPTPAPVPAPAPAPA